MPVGDTGLAPPPAEAYHAVAGHRVEVNEPQIQIAENTTVRRDLEKRVTKLIQHLGAAGLFLAQEPHVQVLARRAGALDGAQHLDLALQGHDLASDRRNRIQRLFQERNQLVRLIHREDLVSDPFHRIPPAERSEEHTSELQSPYDLVCRLLLEKKNK